MSVCFINHSISPAAFTAARSKTFPVATRYREINGNGIYMRNIYFAQTSRGTILPDEEERKGRTVPEYLTG